MLAVADRRNGRGIYRFAANGAMPTYFASSIVAPSPTEFSQLIACC